MNTKMNMNLIRRFIASVCVICLTAGLLASITTVAAQAGKLPAIKITLIADGSEWEYVTYKRTVKDVIHESGIALGPKDRVIPSLSSSIKQGSRIRVVRIKEEVITKNDPIPFKTITKFDNKSTARSQVVVTKGQPGERQVKTMVTYKDGVKIHTKTISSKVIKAPVNEVVVISKSAFLASRSGMKIPHMRMKATAYDPSLGGTGKSGRTATGLRAGHGVVAVDPRVIPLGTKLYVEGYGFCIAGDTGGSIKGNRIDLGFNTYGEAKRFGRRTVTVYILD